MQWYEIHHGSFWHLSVPKKGSGEVSKRGDSSFKWSVTVWHHPKGEEFNANVISSGWENTLEEAKRQVEETFDMIEEY